MDSTNTYIRNHPDLWDRQFCAVVANEQTAGRGRFDRRWLSAPGLDLAFSLVFLPPVGTSDCSCVTLLAGLAVRRALAPYCGTDLNLKWPNDIRLGAKKIGGILCELVPGSGRSTVIIGIGINVNRVHFPEELRATATSLKTATGTDHSVEELFRAIHRHCLRLLSDFRVPLDEILIDEWITSSHSIGVPVRFAINNRIYHGIVSGINRDCSLRISGDSGESIDGYRGEVLFPDDI